MIAIDPGLRDRGRPGKLQLANNLNPRLRAVRGWTVCRFHGAHGGAPKGQAKRGLRGGMGQSARSDLRMNCSTGHASWLYRSASRFGGFALAISHQVHDGRGTERH